MAVKRQASASRRSSQTIQRSVWIRSASGSIPALPNRAGPRFERRTPPMGGEARSLGWLVGFSDLYGDPRPAPIRVLGAGRGSRGGRSVVVGSGG